MKTFLSKTLISVAALALITSCASKPLVYDEPEAVYNPTNLPTEELAQISGSYVGFNNPGLHGKLINVYGEDGVKLIKADWNLGFVVGGAKLTSGKYVLDIGCERSPVGFFVKTNAVFTTGKSYIIHCALGYRKGGFGLLTIDTVEPRFYEVDEYQRLLASGYFKEEDKLARQKAKPK